MAILDGVPVAAHTLLGGRLIVNDLFGLEPGAVVEQRNYGTAMASLVVHGDRNEPQTPLPRLESIDVPVLGSGRFPRDRLIIDVIYQAIRDMKAGPDPSSPDVVVVNLSLGNARGPFQGRVSAWARPARSPLL